VGELLEERKKEKFHGARRSTEGREGGWSQSPKKEMNLSHEYSGEENKRQKKATSYWERGSEGGRGIRTKQKKECNLTVSNAHRGV